MMRLKGKNILVVGLGVSGQACVRFLLRQGAFVTAVDQRNKLLFRRFLDSVSGLSLGRLGERLNVHFGSQPIALFRRRDLIVVSPGVPLDLPGLKTKTPVIGEFGLAALFLRPPVIAVTGTNGKSTTVTLIHEMLRAGKIRSALAGNIGTPLLEVVMSRRQPAWVVAEVSSYQLETAPRFHPKISVLLNVTEDHLDRYRSMKEYAQAKFRIFAEQKGRDLLIGNDRDPIVRRGMKKFKGRCLSIHSPSLFVQRGIQGNAIHFQNERYSLEKSRLVGEHNLENQMAAVAAARCAGVSRAVVQKTLDRFKGLPHRTEFVRTVGGVRFYDDSKGTNTDAVVKSLAGFPDGRVILIVGGRDKGGSYAALRKRAGQKAKLVIAIGEARQHIARSMKGSTPVRVVERLEKAVPLAVSKACAGDVVLLSPACSSFDQFRDYKERGDRFQKLVKGL